MALKIPDQVASASGLALEDASLVRDLVKTWREKLAGNMLKEDYYEGHVKAKNLGLTVPPNLRMEPSCGWPAKAVDYIASRSQFDGFTVGDDETAAKLRQIVADNDLKNMYATAVTSELIHCACLVTVVKGEEGEPAARINMVPATAGSIIWDDRKGQVEAGLTVVKTERRGRSSQRVPTWLEVFTATDVITIKQDQNGIWKAVYQPHSMGRPLIEVMAHRPTLKRPMGRSAITRTVKNLTDCYMREAIRCEIGAEFSAVPQKYLLGTAGNVLAEGGKWNAYSGSIFAISKDEDGDVPQFGQLAQGSMQPHIDYIRSLAGQVSGETNVPVSALGITTDNPASADAIRATKEDAIIAVQRLNSQNGKALANIALMALAIQDGAGNTYASELAAHPEIAVRWKNPALPSIASQSDAMVKQIGAIPWLAESPVALEQLGYDDEQIQRLEVDKRRAKGQTILDIYRPESLS